MQTTKLRMRQKVAPVLLAVTLVFSTAACNIGDDPVDDTEEQLEDKADDVEEDVRDAG